MTINAVDVAVQGYSNGQGGTMTKAPVAPQWSGSETLPAGTVGSPYSHDLSQYLSGNYTPVISKTAESDAWPSGMSLVSGEATGTPTTEANVTLQFNGVNGAGSALSAAINLIINAMAAATAEFTAIASATDQIDLSWDHTDYPDATGFQIYRSPVTKLLIGL